MMKQSDLLSFVAIFPLNH